MRKRVFLIVIDGFGVGEAPDSYKYNDEGSNTFLNVYNQTKMELPNLYKLGLKNIDGLKLEKPDNPIGVYAKLQEKSAGKDTTTGHFEMMEIISEKPGPTFPNGFPKEIVDKLEEAFGVKIIGNKVASGTGILEEYGDEHLKTKMPIIYTSADSVLQIATHTDVYSFDELYEMCEKAREIMQGEYAVGRVIARPFHTNENGEFERLGKNRKDFSLSPKKPNTMSKLVENGFDVISVGKISDIFNHESITKDYPSHTNEDAMNDVKNEIIKLDFNGLCFVNLVDTDMLYGHRNDVIGYSECLKQFDKDIPYLIENLRDEDYLIITGDHGNDPTTPSTDHSREYTPFILFNKKLSSKNLGILQGFDSIGKYIDSLFNIIGEESEIKNLLEK